MLLLRQQTLLIYQVEKVLHNRSVLLSNNLWAGVGLIIWHEMQFGACLVREKHGPKNGYATDGRVEVGAE